MNQPANPEATRKALDIYRSLRHPAGEAQTFLAVSRNNEWAAVAGITLGGRV